MNNLCIQNKVWWHEKYFLKASVSPLLSIYLFYVTSKKYYRQTLEKIFKRQAISIGHLNKVLIRSCLTRGWSNSMDSKVLV